jgi:hypothetical protein
MQDVVDREGARALAEVTPLQAGSFAAKGETLTIEVVQVFGEQ